MSAYEYSCNAKKLTGIIIPGNTSLYPIRQHPYPLCFWGNQLILEDQGSISIFRHYHVYQHHRC